MSLIPEAIPMVCAHCSKSVLGQTEGSHQGYDPEHGPPLLSLLISCTSCGQSSLFLSEDYGGGWDEPTRVWPAPGRRLGLSVPRELRDEHEQARLCFEAKAYTAAGVMVRRTLEGVCAVKGTKKRNLFEGLREMKESGAIDERLFDWAQALRILGNQGAHYTGTQISREDAEDALDLCEALLDYMFELTAKFTAFQQRRKTPMATEDKQ
ncbi:DUF4145 domain-containing protein [Amycolatopsis sp. NPDC049868]|uniref:DUF4145 domain-containing protein n=1 Tax=Amycolatopsis sp. NPDC049868 TaxID=3363934 RepID=UPI0037B5DDAB